MFKQIDFSHFPLEQYLYLREDKHPGLSAIIQEFKTSGVFPDTNRQKDQRLRKQVVWLKIVVLFFRQIDEEDLHKTLAHLKNLTLKEVHITMQLRTAEIRNVVLFRVTAVNWTGMMSVWEYDEAIREFFKLRHDEHRVELQSADISRETYQLLDEYYNPNHPKVNSESSYVLEVGSQWASKVVNNAEDVTNLIEARVYLWKLSQYGLEYDEDSSFFVIYDAPFKPGTSTEEIEMPFFLNRLMSENTWWDGLNMTSFLERNNEIHCEKGIIKLCVYRGGPFTHTFAIRLAHNEVPKWSVHFEHCFSHDRNKTQMIGAAQYQEASGTYRVFGSLYLDRKWPNKSENLILSTCSTHRH